ncbi:MAG: hypothetical protein ACM3KD_11030, partial [Hyphomicrobiaceae bacterium]
MGELKTAVAARDRQVRPSVHGRHVALSILAPVFLEDMQREHSELFAWLTDYNHAVTQGAGRSQLLAIFD